MRWTGCEVSGVISFEVQELHGQTQPTHSSSRLRRTPASRRRMVQVLSFGKIHGGKGSEELEKFCYTVHAKFPDTQVPNAAGTPVREGIGLWIVHPS
jgi:hypothetical protein